MASPVSENEHYHYYNNLFRGGKKTFLEADKGNRLCANIFVNEAFLEAVACSSLLIQ